MLRRFVLSGLVAAALAVWAEPAAAQYFGRNKVQYRTFEFQVLATDHFDLYYYPEEREAAQIASRMAERWYSRLSRFFGHELRGRQAIILYATSSHFRQTNAVEGLIGEGTGGLTEALKRRIVLPMSGSLGDTDHVIGHELVHAFQFDMTGTDPREGNPTAPGILDFPLWFVEGMAEYLSLGPVDAPTAMWLRDAALREKLPHIRDLDDPKYFPYRWGHAFWAYIGATYGDRAVGSLIRSAANPRSDLAGLARQLGTDPDGLTQGWHQAILLAAQAVAAGRSSLASGPRLVLNQKSGGGRYNVGPRVSPDGRWIAFFSSRDIFSVDLYLADAETGRVVRRLSRSSTDPHFDSLEFLNSAGAWSPDGSQLALAAVRGGRPVIALIDPRSGDVVREVKLPGLDDVIDPVFAPDGRSIVVSGNQGGLIDLYEVTLDSGKLDRLTQDPYADLEAAFTPDGRTLVFATERFTTDLASLRPGPLRLARYDRVTRAVTPIPGFLKGKHISPQVSADGRTVTFIAEPDGVSNLYRMAIDGGPIVQVSSFPTGIAGITASSPALSSAPGTGRLAFSVFEDDGHAIYVLDEAQVVSLVAPPATGVAANLPGRKTPPGDVERLLTDTARGLPAASAPRSSTPYRQKLLLDFVGQPTVSAGVNQFGGFVSGSISAFFSDMLGDRQLGLAAQVSNSLADIGGQVSYVNRRHRWNWGAAAEVTPIRFGFLTRKDRDDGIVQIREVVNRQTSNGVSLGVAYPLSTATRVEAMGVARRLSFTQDITTALIDRSTSTVLARETGRTSIGAPLYLAETSAALVHDTSFFGATAPIYGGRSRLEVAHSIGTLQYTTFLADWRRYYMPKRPATIAVRAMHYGRYGLNSEDPRLLALYGGYPEFVHGYGTGTFSPIECQAAPFEARCAIFDRLIGSRMIVANVELRAPLMSLVHGQLQYGRVPIDVVLFADAGLVWTSATRPTFAGGTRAPFRSVGAAVRGNALGFVVLELAVSRPLDRVDTGWQWQFGIRQGF